MDGIRDATKRMEKNLDGNYTRMLRDVPNRGSTDTNHPSQKPSKLDEPDMRDTAEEVRTNSWAMYSCGPLHTDEQELDDQLESIYNSSVLIQDVAWKTYRERWTIGTNDERRSGKSVLTARYDVDYDTFSISFSMNNKLCIVWNWFMAQNVFISQKYLFWGYSKWHQIKSQSSTEVCHEIFRICLLFHSISTFLGYLMSNLSF